MPLGQNPTNYANPVNYSSPATSTAPELASQLLVAKGKLVLATRILGEVRKIAQGMDFRHNGIHCLCPICTDMRHAVQAILVASEGTLEKLQEPGIMGMVDDGTLFTVPLKWITSYPVANGIITDLSDRSLSGKDEEI